MGAAILMPADAIFEVSIAIVNPRTRTEEQMRAYYTSALESAAHLAHEWGHERTATVRQAENNPSLFLGAVTVHRWVPKPPLAGGYIQPARVPFHVYEWKYDWGKPEPIRPVPSGAARAR